MLNRTTIAMLLATTMLAACSEGGESGDSPILPALVSTPITTAPVVTTPPAEVPPVTMQPEEDDPAPVTQPAITDPPPVEPPPVVTDTPPVVVTPPLDAGPAPETGLALIGDLFGTLRLDYSFANGTDNSFFVVTRYSAADLTANGNLVAVAISGGSADGTVLPNANTALACSVTGVDEEFFCLMRLGESTVLFAFDPLASGRASGTFEFCPNGTSTEDCVRDLIVTPDGGLVAQVDAAIAARLAVSSIDLAPYLAYEAQGVPTARSRPVDAETTARIDAISSAMGTLLDR